MSSSAPAPATATKPLSFMEKLGPLVFFYRPSEASSTDATLQPRLIIISSWTDARDAHIAKYIAKYQALYPAAQILLLRSTMDCIVRPSQIGPAMRVAASVVRAAFQEPVLSSSPPPLLVHTFSNGGSSSLANLYEQFAATAGPNDDKRLPSHVTIFDSCPGLFRIPRAVAFVSVGLPFFQQLIAAPFLYAFAAFWTASMALGLLPNSLSSWYKSHNEEVGNTAEVRRVYIYSATDALTDYKDVETHAAEAKTNGFSVTLEKYEGSAHVAHLRKDETRYWDIVKRTMEG
jgi:pimeloyl-ACP methyl ester carboxylesterase